MTSHLRQKSAGLATAPVPSPDGHLIATQKVQELVRGLSQTPELLDFTVLGGYTTVARGAQTHLLMYSGALAKNPVWLVLCRAATVTLGTLGPFKHKCPAKRLIDPHCLDALLERSEDERYILALQTLTLIGSVNDMPGPVRLSPCGLRARTPRGMATLSLNDEEYAYVIRLGQEVVVPLGEGRLWRGVPEDGTGKTAHLREYPEGFLTPPSPEEAFDQPEHMESY